VNADDPRQAALDARLRALLGGIDAAAGFEERVMQRVAKLAAAPHADLRAQFERGRELARRRLRREAWLNVIMMVGLGACAGALLWRFAPQIQRLMAGAAATVDVRLLAVGTLAALGVAVWLLMNRMQSGR
jgi:hypothetical protein